MIPTLSEGDLEQFDLLIAQVREDPLYVRRLVDEAARGKDVPDYCLLVQDAACCEYLIAHAIVQGSSLGDAIDDPWNGRRRELMKHASVSELIDMRARVLARVRTRAA